MFRSSAILAAFALCLIAACLDAQSPEVDTFDAANITSGTIGDARLPPAAHYRHHGPAVLNDLTVTPGVASSRTKAQLCDPKFRTGTVRNVPESLKLKVCREYGLANCHGVEVDHLISLVIGGTNDMGNLWPEAYEPKPGARQKDALEDHLAAMVCRGDISLHDAQYGISNDWYALYLKLGLNK